MSIGEKRLELQELLILNREQVLLADMMLDPAQTLEVENLLLEHRFRNELETYHLPVNHKLLLHGCSGCGKTMLAKAIATAMKKELWILDLGTVISARIGETSRHLKLVFEKATKSGAMLFLDEFDQIGKSRGHTDKDVGEVRRLVNTLLQLIDRLPSEVLLIAATNHLEILDQALIRRFQLRLEFISPSQAALDDYYDKILAGFPSQFVSVQRKYNISYAEAKDYALTSVKAALLNKLQQDQQNNKAHG